MNKPKCYTYDIKSEYTFKDKDELIKDAMNLVVMSGFVDNFEVADACIIECESKKVMVVVVVIAD